MKESHVKKLLESAGNDFVDVVMEGYRACFESMDEDYRGEHTAPVKEDSPMHDLTNTFPSDIYSPDAARMYGTNGGDDMDRQSIQIIQSAKGRPRKAVKVYRAVPNENIEVDKEIKVINDLFNYMQKFGFTPVGDKNKYRDLLVEVEYDDDAFKQKLHEKIDALIAKRKPTIKKINPGDWISISLGYAKEHGRDHLNNRFKIISKTVRASDLNTDGNSIHEWGYNP